MSNLDSLRDFIAKQIRNPNLGPVGRNGKPDTRSLPQKDKDALAETNRAMASERRVELKLPERVWLTFLRII